jgi:hypothetical protein
MISARPIAFFADFRPTPALRGIFVAAALAAFAVPSVADARTGAYDGIWNVTFTPQAGNCHASNTLPFTVSGKRVSSAGGGKVTGGITGNGNVSVRISVGASWANGGGRLNGKSGAGRWSGVITGDRCSGIWAAARS